MKLFYALSLCLVLFSALFFTQCITNSSSPTGPNVIDTSSHGKTNNGFAIFTNPRYYTRVRNDSTLSIQWISSDSTGYVAIELFRDDTLVYTISNATLSDGAFAWYIYNSVIPSSTRYRLRIVDYYDTTLYDFSQTFSIYSRYFGILDVTTPGLGTIDTLGSTLPITWTTTDSVGYYVRIDLYKGQDSVYAITSSTSNDGYYTWSSIYSPVGSGTDYKIVIRSTSDLSIKGVSGIFTLRSAYSGSYTISEPVVGDTLQASTIDTIRWTTTGSPGSYVNIKLYNLQDSLVSTIASSTYDYGYYAFTIPGSIVSGRYRIRVESYYDQGIYDSSDLVYIKALDADSFENDGARTVAKPITTNGVVQSHTLTLNDTDWVTFTGRKGTSYLITNEGTLSTRLYVYLGSSTSYSTSLYGGSYTSSPYVVWACDSTTTYYLRVAPLYSYEYGTYTLSIADLDSLALVTYSSPITSSVWSAGSYYDIQWTTSPLMTYGAVSIALYTDSVFLLDIDTYESDDGLYTWYLPTGLPTGNKYRIKITDYSNTTLYGYSDYFTIEGVAPDDYEPDNTRGTASPIVVGAAAQQHSHSLNDTDWVSFSGQDGKTYLISNAGDHYTLLALYVGNSTSAATSFYGGSYTTSPYIFYTCDSTATCYIRITPYSTSYMGDYTVSVVDADSLHLATFSNPTATTVWSASSSYDIQWTSDSAVLSDYVTLALYNDTFFVATLYSGAANDGLQTVSLPSGLASGSHYRIKVIDSYNSSLYSYSDQFTISGLTPDGYEIDDAKTAASAITIDGTVQSRVFTYRDTDWVAFPAIADSIYIIRGLNLSSYTTYMYLYNAASTSYLTYTSSYMPQLVWTCPTSGTYYLRLNTSSSGTSTGNYTLSVREHSANSLVDFIDPTASTTWSTGSAYIIQWNPDTALFSQYVALQLYRDSTFILTISSSTANTGTRTWTIPTGLATGSSYRLRMINTNISQVAGFSHTFTISGMAPDSYEPDDSLSQAHAMGVLGTPENHSLTYSDVDWYSFSAQAGFMYKIETAGLPYQQLILYSTNGTTQLSSDSPTGTDSIAAIVWYCPTAGTYYFQTSASYYGAYTGTVTAYDSTQHRFAVTAPAAGQIDTIGNTLTITWTDPLSIGGYVDIFLYNSTGVVETIIPANTPNDGSHTWVIPTTVAPGSTYYVKVVSRFNSNIYGNSAVFTIAP